MIPTAFRDDFVRPFLLETGNIGGRFLRLDRSLEKILSKHAYPLIVETLLAEMLVLTSLIASTLKFDGILTLQIRGDGPVNLVVADVQTQKAGKSNPDKDQSGGNFLNLRGYAAFDQERVSKLQKGVSIPKIVGCGNLTFTLDQGPLTQRYQGIVALEGATLLDCFQHYFIQSDQFDIAFNLAVQGSKKIRGCGLSLQCLPERGGYRDKARDKKLEWMDKEAHEESWRCAVLLLGTAGRKEMLNPDLDANDLLFRLFHTEGIRLFDCLLVQAKCRCSGDRILATLKSLSPDELDYAQKDGKVTATCEFCLTDYGWTLEEIRG